MREDSDKLYLVIKINFDARSKISRYTSKTTMTVNEKRILDTLTMKRKLPAPSRNITDSLPVKKRALTIDELRTAAIEGLLKSMITRVVSNFTELRKRKTTPHSKPAAVKQPKEKVTRRKPKPKLFITIPELLPNFPFAARYNLPDDDALSENMQWVTSFGFEIDISYRRVYNVRYTLTMRKVEKEQTVLILNMMAVLSITEAMTDDMCASDVEHLRDVMEDVLRNPNKKRSKRDERLSLLFQSFCQCVFTAGTPFFRKRFTESWSEYMDSILCKAQDRAYSRYRDIASYIELRQSTIGMRPLQDLLFLYKDYPKWMLMDPQVAEMERWAMETISLIQDICAYNVLQASHIDTHNFIGVYRHEKSCSIQEAVNYVAKRCVDASRQFVAALNNISPPLDPMRWYFDELGAMAAGNHDWSFIAPENRFGPEILNTRTFEVLPKER